MNLRWIVLAAAMAVLGLWAGLWFWTTGAPPWPVGWLAPAAAPPAESLEDRVAALRAELAAEHDARLALEAEVAMLRLLLDDYGGGRPAPPAAAPPAASATSPEGAPSPPGGEPIAAAPPPETAPANAGGALWFDAPGLQAQGVSAEETARLHGIFEDSELQILYLRDRATREGWAGTPRFLEEMQQMRADLRESVGDDTFDWLLYATQRTNRVAVAGLLSTGPAAQAGIQAGDVILRYDGRAIFKGPELQQATTQGEAGRLVPVDVMSPNGEVRRVRVPSGPLGIQLMQQRRAPQASR